MAFGGKMPTVLEQLLEEINFQRTKEMRHLMKDGELFWSNLYSRDLFRPTLIMDRRHSKCKQNHFSVCTHRRNTPSIYVQGV